MNYLEYIEQIFNNKLNIYYADKSSIRKILIIPQYLQNEDELYMI